MILYYTSRWLNLIVKRFNLKFKRLCLKCQICIIPTYNFHKKYLIPYWNKIRSKHKSFTIDTVIFFNPENYKTNLTYHQKNMKDTSLHRLTPFYCHTFFLAIIIWRVGRLWRDQPRLMASVHFLNALIRRWVGGHGWTLYSENTRRPQINISWFFTAPPPSPSGGRPTKMKN